MGQVFSMLFQLHNDSPHLIKCGNNSNNNNRMYVVNSSCFNNCNTKVGTIFIDAKFLCIFLQDSELLCEKYSCRLYFYANIKLY